MSTRTRQTLARLVILFVMSWTCVASGLGAVIRGDQIAPKGGRPKTIPTALPKRQDVLRAMKLANDYFTARWPNPGTNDGLPGKRSSVIWTRAVYFEGALALYRANQDRRILDYAIKWAEFHRWNLKTGEGTQNADDQCAGQAYIELYQLDPAKTERLSHIRANLDNWARSEKVNFYTWVDALQMSMPNFAKLGVIDRNPAYFEKMYALYRYAKTTLGLYNPEDKLWWRDAAFKPPFKTPNGRQSYWSRGNGWVLAALVRVLDVMPRNHPHYAEYETMFKDMCSALLRVQREDGFWNVSLGDPHDFGGPETTGTSLFIYGFAWGVKKGVLPAKDYLPALTKGWNAIVTHALHANGFLGYVQGTGHEPASGQPVTYDSIPDFEDYGLGCFLLAGSEIHALAVQAQSQRGDANQHGDNNL